MSAAVDGPLIPRSIGNDELLDLFKPLIAYETIVLAVSGGADSTALMLLAGRWCGIEKRNPAKVHVVTVDHGLRPESAAEACWVKGEAESTDFKHATLVWTGDKPKSGLQDAARRARYGLLAKYATEIGAGQPTAVVTAHTGDDQAETFLMRLARGSGADGLAGMPPNRPLVQNSPVRLLRPLLGVAKARLIATLSEAGKKWLEDSSNHSMTFERVRIRRAAAVLGELGMSSEMIAESARRLDRARVALNEATDALGAEADLETYGGAYASLNWAVFAKAPEELQLRMLAYLLREFGGQAEAARLAKIEDLLQNLMGAQQRTQTLGGCLIVRDGGKLCVFRELGRQNLPSLVLEAGQIAVWDHRFEVLASEPAEVRALGDAGYSTVLDNIGTGLAFPARAAATLPAFWRGATLLAVPQLANVAPVLSGRNAQGQEIWRSVHRNPCLR